MGTGVGVASGVGVGPGVDGLDPPHEAIEATKATQANPTSAIRTDFINSNTIFGKTRHRFYSLVRDFTSHSDYNERVS